MRIHHYGEPVLRAEGEPVTDFGAGLQSLSEEMVATMHEAEGIGLAAQQIGRALQFCVVDVRPGSGEAAPFSYSYDGKQPPLDLIMPLAIANPEVTIIDPEEVPYEEGCLSFPDVRANITRPVAIKVDFKDTGGNTHTLTCDGLLARCILHEVDHLNGILFIDHMNREDLKRNDAAIRRVRRDTRGFIEVEGAKSEA